MNIPFLWHESDGEEMMGRWEAMDLLTTQIEG